MLDYSALAAMAAVVREGSFDRAARALNVTPSAISQRVKLLEERVGCALVVRGQPCSATETGQRLCQHIDRVRLLEQDLQDALPSLTSEHQAKVEMPIAVNADSLATWFLPALTAFAVKAPVLMDVVVDDQDYTSDWLHSGKVLAAVTASAQPAVGCSSSPLGAMRYLAVASPAFIARHFPTGVDVASLRVTPSLVFNTKDELQTRWAERQCHQQIELPRHKLPSPQAFVAATIAGMGWGMHPQSLIAAELKRGELIELVPDTPFDVPLYWQCARSVSTLLDGLTAEILAAATSLLILAD